MTVYAFSTENFQRESNEVQTLMNLCKDELKKASKDSRIHKNKVRIRVLGQLDSLPGNMSESAQSIMNQTKDYDNYSFNIALAYSGREEIIQAIQKIAGDVKEGKLKIDDIKEPIVSKYLWLLEFLKWVEKDESGNLKFQTLSEKINQEEKMVDDK